MFQILKKWFSSNLETTGDNNIVNYQDFPDCHFKICGDRNQIIINPTTKLIGKISIYGDNNLIYIARECNLNVEIDIGRPQSSFAGPAEKCHLNIGHSVYMGNAHLVMAENGSSIRIGDNCTFGAGAQIWATDMHSMLDENGQLTNYGHFVQIGSHVWCGLDVKILKNTQIASDSVVGAGSIISSKFHEEQVLIAGNPARILKHNIAWNKLTPNRYRERE